MTIERPWDYCNDLEQCFLCWRDLRPDQIHEDYQDPPVCTECAEICQQKDIEYERQLAAQTASSKQAA